jgi:hypothetical protein
VEVRWPSGAVDVLRDQSADRLLTIEEGVGLIASEPFLKE